MDIDSIKRRLLVKYPSFGSVIANLEYIEDKKCKTAGTDGERVLYNPEFLKNLSDDEQTFLFAHEVCHVAFNHILRSEGKDKRLWNEATDAVINALLRQDGMQMIKGGVDIPEASEYDAEEMYEKLLKEKEEERKKQGEIVQEKESGEGSDLDPSQEGNSGGNARQDSESETRSVESNDGYGNNVGHDDHDLWDDAIENKKKKENLPEEDKNEGKRSLWERIFNRNKQEKSSSESEAGKDNSEEEISSEAENEKREQIKRLTESGEKSAFNNNKIERKKQLEELRESLAKQSTGAGHETRSEEREVRNIGTARALIDWRRILKEAINLKQDWSYKNAYIEDGVVTPQLEDFLRSETEILLDTSGSIDESLLRNFLRECKNILQTSKVKAGCFDTKFYGFDEIRTEKDIDNMKFKGGGGTDFDTAVNAFSLRVENKIIFTDGEAPMPKKSVDAVWIVFGEREIKPKGGRVIYINERQLERLYGRGRGGMSR